MDTNGAPRLNPDEVHDGSLSDATSLDDLFKAILGSGSLEADRPTHTVDREPVIAPTHSRAETPPQRVETVETRATTHLDADPLSPPRAESTTDTAKARAGRRQDGTRKRNRGAWAQQTPPRPMQAPVPAPASFPVSSATPVPVSASGAIGGAVSRAVQPQAPAASASTGWMSAASVRPEPASERAPQASRLLDLASLTSDRRSVWLAGGVAAVLIVGFLVSRTWTSASPKPSTSPQRAAATTAAPSAASAPVVPTTATATPESTTSVPSSSSGTLTSPPASAPAGPATGPGSSSVAKTTADNSRSTGGAQSSTGGAQPSSGQATSAPALVPTAAAVRAASPAATRSANAPSSGRGTTSPATASSARRPPAASVAEAPSTTAAIPVSTSGPAAVSPAPAASAVAAPASSTPTASTVAATPPSAQALASAAQTTAPSRTTQDAPVETPSAPPAAAAPRDSAAGSPPPVTAASAAPAPQQVTRDPVLVSSVRPVYPESARRSATLGDVEIDVTIDATGRVTRASPVSGPVVLRAAATAAVLQWRYQPAAVNGTPAASRRRVRVSFQ